MALTEIKIKALKPRSVRYLVTDGRGLCIEMLPSGKLSWILRYRLHGRPEKLVMGRYPDLSLKVAREERDRFAGVIAKGKSPAKEKKLAKLAPAGDATVQEFGELYFVDNVQRNVKDPRNVRRYLEKEIYPAFGKKPLKDVTAADVQALVFRKRDNGPARVRQLSCQASGREQNRVVMSSKVSLQRRGPPASFGTLASARRPCKAFLQEGRELPILPADISICWTSPASRVLGR